MNLVFGVCTEIITVNNGVLYVILDYSVNYSVMKIYSKHTSDSSVKDLCVYVCVNCAKFGTFYDFSISFDSVIICFFFNNSVLLRV